jgi:hypothetical protein
MHFLFGLALIVLVVLLVRETMILIGLLFQLAGYLFALAAPLAWLPIAAGIELRRYFKRRRMVRAVGLAAVEHELNSRYTIEGNLYRG